MTHRILVLGGISEALTLCETMPAPFDPILSLAGRTSNPVTWDGPTRRGGFGGRTGLAEYVQEEGIAAIIDCLHPFAQIMRDHAIWAARETGVPLYRRVRPVWQPSRGITWERVQSVEEALGIVNSQGYRRIFAAIGRKQIHAFHFLDMANKMGWQGSEEEAIEGEDGLVPPTVFVRSVDPPFGALPPNIISIVATGPFSEEHERQLLSELGIDVLICRNSGLAALFTKVQAAHDLGIAIIMIDQPERLAPVGHGVREFTNDPSLIHAMRADVLSPSALSPSRRALS